MEVNIVGVAGLGLLGRGIASCLLAHDITVVAYDLSPIGFAEARTAIAHAIHELVQRGYCSPSLQTDWQKRYTEATSLAQFAACDFVIESIVESLEAKAKLFDQLEAFLPSTVPVASNTSALPITLLQKDREHPHRFLGMHWAEPAHATRFLELIRGDLTNDESMHAAARLALRLGKDPCVVQQDIPGFIANRIGYAMYREACNLLTMGVADAETIDRSFRNSVGLWATVCGPFRWIDLTGGPALYGKAMAGVLPTLSNATEVPEPIASMMQANVGGIRDGHGFFEYTPAEAKAWEDIYREHVWRVRKAADEVFPLHTEAR
jgi:3-hydroxybutyryl-CoA dehydrogenase